jgi:uncharacterized membrane protein YdbT with pleckstrin-like domain
MDLERFTPEQKAKISALQNQAAETRRAFTRRYYFIVIVNMFLINLLNQMFVQDYWFVGVGMVISIAIALSHCHFYFKDKFDALRKEFDEIVNS